MALQHQHADLLRGPRVHGRFVTNDTRLPEAGPRSLVRRLLRSSFCCSSVYPGEPISRSGGNADTRPRIPEFVRVPSCPEALWVIFSDLGASVAG
jgi:hypothetical protein